MASTRKYPSPPEGNFQGMGVKGPGNSRGVGVTENPLIWKFQRAGVGGVSFLNLNCDIIYEHQPVKTQCQILICINQSTWIAVERSDIQFYCTWNIMRV